MTTAERLFEEARRLPPEEIAWLVDQLSECLEEEAMPPLSPAWEAEIARRVEAIDNGTVTPMPIEEARARWGLPARHDVDITPRAFEEGEGIIDAYDAIGEDLGTRFRAAMADALARMEQFPGSGTPAATGLRWLRIAGFPYRFVYRANTGGDHRRYPA